MRTEKKPQFSLGIIFFLMVGLVTTGFRVPLLASASHSLAPAKETAAQTVLLSEDFEDGFLDDQILVSTTGTFNDTPMIKPTTQFGSTKAYGFGRSTCGSSCFGDFTTTLTIVFSEPTYISTLSFKAAELYDNWGSFGFIKVDGLRISNVDDFAHPIDNGHIPDSGFRDKRFIINERVTQIDLLVWDITNLSEVFIDDLLLTGSPCSTPPEVALAWWPGDGHPFDLVEDNDGTLTNGAAYAGGLVGRAFSFDGVDDYVIVPNSSSLQTLAENFSIEAWVRPESLPSGDPYYDKGIVVREGYVRGFALMTKGSVFGMWIGGGSGTGLAALSSPITPNRWYHVVGTYDGTTARIYVNGELEGTKPASLIHYDTPIKIGTSQINERFFDGQIDEVTIYDRTLSVEEIDTLYGGCTVSAPTDMVLYWPFDEEVGTTANDVMGSNDGTLTNGPVWAVGKIGNALSFDGVNDYVALPDAASTLLNNVAGAISVWINPTAVGDNDIIVGFGDTGTCHGSTIGLGLWNVVRPWHCLGDWDWHSTTPVSANEWTHLAYTWDDTTEYIYKNGQFSESRPRNFNYAVGLARIGNGWWGDSSNAFPGLIDELKVFNRTLSADEIEALNENLSSPPQDAAVKWTFEEGTGTTTDDIMGANNAALVNGPLWSSGKHGLSLRFDGTNDYLSAPDSSLWDLGSADFSIAGWVNTPTPGSTMRLIAAGSEADGTNNLWALGYGSNGAWGSGNRINLSYWNGSGYVDFSSDPLNLGSGGWNQIAIVRTGTTLRFYFNGSPAGSQDIGTLSLGGGSTGAIIGARYHATSSNVGEFANGLIDEVELYPCALSASEIAALYTFDCQGKCKPCLDQTEDLAAWWRFHEGEGETAQDIIGGNDGTLHGSSWANGKVNSGLSFDGENDYVAIPDSPTWDLGSADFTLEGWVKTGTPGETMRLIAAGSAADGANNLWAFGYGSNGAWGGGNRMNLTYWNGSAYTDLNSEQIPLGIGAWSYLAVVRSGSTLTFYFDGVPAGSLSVGTLVLNGGSSGAIIGARYHASSAVIDEYAQGMIDEVGLYQRALNADEIAALYASGCAGKCVPDLILPTIVSLTRLDEDPTNLASLDYALVFSEPVTGLDLADFSITTGGTLAGTSVSLIQDIGDQTTYTVTLGTGSGDGTLRLDIPDSAAIVDLALNPLDGLPYTGGETYTVDKSNPYVDLITRLDPSPTFADSVDFMVTFSEAVTEPDGGDFYLTLTGDLFPQPVTIVGVSTDHTVYTTTVSTGTGSGTMRLNVHQDSDVEDLAGNLLIGLPYAYGETYVIRIAEIFLPVIIR